MVMLLTHVILGRYYRKPDKFPPEDHTHSQDDIDGLGDKLDEIDGQALAIFRWLGG